jgi:hypothetical protein
MACGGRVCTPTRGFTVGPVGVRARATMQRIHPRNGSSLNRRFRRFRRWTGRNASTQGSCRRHLAGEGHARSKLLTICVICDICGSNCCFQVHSSSSVPPPRWGIGGNSPQTGIAGLMCRRA